MLKTGQDEMVIGYSVNPDGRENSAFNNYTIYDAARDLLQELKLPVADVSGRLSPMTKVEERSSSVKDVAGRSMTAACNQDRCAFGWLNFENTCYFFGHEEVTFLEANRKCKQMQGQLVEVECEAEWVFLKAKADKKALDGFWIALTDAFNENDWSWINTWRTVAFTDWYPGEPNNSGSNEHCVHARYRGKYQWNDRDCTDQLPYICEA